MERPKTVNPKVATGFRASVGAAVFGATAQAHAKGFDAAHNARHNRTAPAAPTSAAGSKPPAGGGAKERARRLARIEAGEIKRENGLDDGA